MNKLREAICIVFHQKFHDNYEFEFEGDGRLHFDCKRCNVRR